MRGRKIGADTCNARASSQRKSVYLGIAYRCVCICAYACTWRTNVSVLTHMHAFSRSLARSLLCARSLSHTHEGDCVAWVRADDTHGEVAVTVRRRACIVTSGTLGADYCMYCDLRQSFTRDCQVADARGLQADAAVAGVRERERGRARERDTEQEQRSKMLIMLWPHRMPGATQEPQADADARKNALPWALEAPSRTFLQVLGA